MTREANNLRPFDKAARLDARAVRWTRGFWADRAAKCREVMVPAMGRLMTDPERQRVKFLGNFFVASGAETGRHRGPRWNDGDFYKWLEAAAATLAVSRDSELASQLDELISVIATAQRADGYIHTNIQIRQRAGEKVEPFDNPMDFEMYNMGHLMSAACRHHEATGKSNLLDLAIKAAAFIEKTFTEPTPEQARHGICPSHLMGLCDLFRATDDRAYLDLAVKLLEMRNLVTKGDDDNQDRVPFREHTVAHGHAVRATYLYAGMADIYRETGDASLLPPMKRVWGDLVSRKLYITGGCGALFDGASPDGMKDQLSITRVHQAFGRDYQLPQSTAHNETCAAIGNVLWSWRMFLVTGEAKYVDLVEHTLFNSVLAGVSLDGIRYFYTNTLRQLDKMPVELRWNRHREEVLGCYCCPPNVARTQARVHEYAYAETREGDLYVLLYGGNELHAGEWSVAQQTEYPWDGRVLLTIDGAPSGVRTMSLRIPDWSSGATITVNRKSVAETPAPGSFASLSREWRNGDIVELDMPMPARLIEASPLVEEARNQVAVRRGPIVYCVESVDLPNAVRVQDVHLIGAAKLTARVCTDLLGGIVAIEGKARLFPSIPQSNVGSSLYHDARIGASREIDITLVPYFAWDNRGDGEMSVWLPVSR